jgi:hypothetical protein
MMTVGEAIKLFCRECVGGPKYSDEVRDCGGDKCENGGCDPKGVCLFYKFRLGTGRSSVKTVRKMCLWCMDGNSDLINECFDVKCSLHKFRFGTNPNISDETKKMYAEKLKNHGGVIRRTPVSKAA